MLTFESVETGVQGRVEGKDLFFETPLSDEIKSSSPNILRLRKMMDLFLMTS